MNMSRIIGAVGDLLMILGTMALIVFNFIWLKIRQGRMTDEGGVAVDEALTEGDCDPASAV